MPARNRIAALRASVSDTSITLPSPRAISFVPFQPRYTHDRALLACTSTNSPGVPATRCRPLPTVANLPRRDSLHRLRLPSGRRRPGAPASQQKQLSETYPKVSSVRGYSRMLTDEKKPEKRGLMNVSEPWRTSGSGSGDTTTLVDTLVTAAEQVEAVGAPGIVEVVADKGYHSNETMVGFAAIGVRSYVSEPDRGRRHWKGQAAARDAVYANRRRIRGARGKRLLRQRGELLERPNAHLYETGRMRRVHLRGHPNILKRLLVQVCGVNLGLLMRHLTGVGTPRSLQGRASALVEALIGLLSECWGRVRRFWAPERHDRPDSSWDGPATRQYGHAILD